jgi:hypothetical protein
MNGAKVQTNMRHKNKLLKEENSRRKSKACVLKEMLATQFYLPRLNVLKIILLYLKHTEELTLQVITSVSVSGL